MVGNRRSPRPCQGAPGRIFLWRGWTANVQTLSMMSEAWRKFRILPPRPTAVFLVSRSAEPMTAKIYRPARTAMQSGEANEKWLLEYEPEAPRQIEPLMGWTSSTDMKAQIKLRFDTREEAIAYAQRNGVAYRVEEPKIAARKVVSYSDNFKSNRAV